MQIIYSDAFAGGASVGVEDIRGPAIVTPCETRFCDHDASMSLVNTDMGNQHLYLFQIMTILGNVYAGISAADLRENRAKMGQPYAQGEVMRNWIQKQRNCYSLAALNA